MYAEHRGSPMKKNGKLDESTQSTKPVELDGIKVQKPSKKRDLTKNKKLTELKPSTQSKKTDSKHNKTTRADSKQHKQSVEVNSAKTAAKATSKRDKNSTQPKSANTTKKTDSKQHKKSGKPKFSKTAKSSKSRIKGPPAGWFYHATREADFEVGLDSSTAHSGKTCAYIKSIVPNPKPFGNLMQSFSPDKFLGKRLRMRAWVKSNVNQGTCQLWLRIDGGSKSASMTPGAFDNMDDRPIKGTTDWQQYELVVDVSEASSNIAFGFFLTGKGIAWLDDIEFEAVSKKVSLTGKYQQNHGPKNLNFQTEKESES